MTLCLAMPSVNRAPWFVEQNVGLASVIIFLDLSILASTTENIGHVARHRFLTANNGELLAA
jgi:hypothetical protein